MALQCEVCGGELTARTEGIFLCEACGERYDEARIWKLSMKRQNTPAALSQLRAQARKTAQMAYRYNDSFLFLRADGTVVAIPERKNWGIAQAAGWTGIRALAVGERHIVGLRFDGTVVAAGQTIYGECSVSEWEGIVYITAGEKITLGVKSDGTVVTTDKELAQKLASWSDIRRVELFKNYIVGLRRDRSVIAADRSGSRLAVDRSLWQNVVDVKVQKNTLVGLRRNGTLLAAGRDANTWQVTRASKWKEIITIEANGGNLVGLRDDGSLAADDVAQDLRAISGWRDLVAVSLGQHHAAGLKTDGTIVITGKKNIATRALFRWVYHGENRGIIAMAQDGLIGIRRDGSIACAAYEIPDTVRLFDSIETLDYERQAAAIRWQEARRASDHQR